MGCSLSSRVTGEQPSSKNGQHGKEANRQPKKSASLATVSTSPRRASAAEDSSYEGRLPGGITETLPLPKETNGEQNTVIRQGLAKKPRGLTERQTSADILEELRTQGIIKMESGTSQNRQGDDTMLIATGRPPQKPPAKLEKLEIKKEKENNLMTRLDQLKQELLTGRSSPIADHQSRTTGREGDNSIPEVHNTSSTLELLCLNLDTRSLVKKEEGIECYSFEDFDTVESDANYNTIIETF